MLMTIKINEDHLMYNIEYIIEFAKCDVLCWKVVMY